MIIILQGRFFQLAADNWFRYFYVVLFYGNSFI